VLWTLLATSALCGEWFGQPLDYWGGSPYGPSPPLPPPEEASREDAPPPASLAPPAPSAQPRPFDWSDYTDPTQPEFWREGDYTPPAPLLELIRDPSPENIERYRTWTSQKLQVSAQVSELLAAAERPEPVRWEGVVVVYFYASSCGYCQQNTPHVLALFERGADVMPVHLDRPSPAYPTSTPFTEQMGRLAQVQGTPTWVLVEHGERRTIRGFATVERLEDELRALRAGGK
jgi:thiol-disulfide isomerase/thioredoxin